MEVVSYCVWFYPKSECVKQFKKNQIKISLGVALFDVNRRTGKTELLVDFHMWSGRKKKTALKNGTHVSGHNKFHLNIAMYFSV